MSDASAVGKTEAEKAEDKKLMKMGGKIASVVVAGIAGWHFGNVWGAGLFAAIVAVGWWWYGGGKLEMSPQNQDERETALRQSKFLFYFSFLPEGVNGLLIIAYASSLHANPVIGIALVLAFLSLIAFRVFSVGIFVNALATGNRGMAITAGSMTLATFLVLLLAGFFEYVNTNESQKRVLVESSTRAQQLDGQIQQARDNLKSLAEFADASQVQAEADRIARGKADNSARIKELEEKAHAILFVETVLNQSGKDTGSKLAELSGGCTRHGSWYTQNRCQPVIKLREEIDALKAEQSGKPVYAAGHAKYRGVEAHLDTLLQERANLGNAGTAVATRPDDQVIAKSLNVSESSAAWGKLFVVALFFDLFVFLARYMAEQLKISAGGNQRAANRKKARAMASLAEELGLDMDEVTRKIQAAISGAGSEPEKKTSPPRRDPQPEWNAVQPSMSFGNNRPLMDGLSRRGTGGAQQNQSPHGNSFAPPRQAIQEMEAVEVKPKESKPVTPESPVVVASKEPEKAEKAKPDTSNIPGMDTEGNKIDPLTAEPYEKFRYLVLQRGMLYAKAFSELGVRHGNTTQRWTAKIKQEQGME